MERRRLIFLSALIAVLFTWTGAFGAGNEEMRVVEMAVTTRIVHGGPVDSVRRISSASSKTLYCFTCVVSPDDLDREITHVWYRDGEIVGNHTLPVKGERWRTYSKKCIGEGMKGLWRVEARDPEGKLLKAVEFRVN